MVGGYTNTVSKSYEQMKVVLSGMCDKLKAYMGNKPESEIVLEKFEDVWGKGHRIVYKGPMKIVVKQTKTMLGLFTKEKEVIEQEQETLAEILEPGNNWAGLNKPMVSDPICIESHVVKVLGGKRGLAEILNWYFSQVVDRECNMFQERPYLKADKKTAPC